jgi:hypothetical protein
MLSRLVRLYGSSKWDHVAQFMPGRNARQCRERWRTFLSPSLINGPWSHAEDQFLAALYRQHGSKWSLIAKSFPGRSDCNIKNRWTRHLVTMSLDPCTQALTGAAEASPERHLPSGLEDSFNFLLADPVDHGFLSMDGYINW